MSYCEDYTKWKLTHSKYFTDVAGQEHYRRLAFLSEIIYEHSKNLTLI